MPAFRGKIKTTMNWARVLISFVSALAPAALFIAAPLVPRWTDVLNVGADYSYTAGGLAIAATGIMAWEPDSKKTMLQGIYVALPVLSFAAVALGTVLEFDIDPALRYIVADADGIKPWTLLVVGIAIAVVGAAVVAHWPGTRETEELKRPIPSAAGALVHLALAAAGLGLAVAGSVDSNAIAVTGAATGLSAISFGLLATFWYQTQAADHALSLLIGIECLALVADCIVVGYLYQLGSNAAGTTPLDVAWLFFAASCVKLVQWGEFHRPLP